MQPPTQWTPSSALPLLLSTTLALAYALSILAYPPRNRKRALLALSLPILYAFKHMLDLTPSATINDTFGRFLYIWFAHISHVFCILKFVPSVAGENDGWRERVRQSAKVLFTRHPSGARRKPPHGYSSLAFCLHHALKTVFLASISHVWDTHIDPSSSYTPADFHPTHASFLRRLPASCNSREVRTRFMMTFQHCVGGMLFFESLHSGFAVLFVGVLRLDGAGEWEMGLFGGLAEVWSVRRYWGVYWHDFVYESFVAHAKVVTRGWMGLRRGMGRRVLENGVVFLVSGLLHSAVRYVQTEGDGDGWCIAVWYASQVVPMVVEGVVQGLWAKSGLRVCLQRRVGERGVVRLERGVGYVWVFGWMFWSVPKYVHTRNAWDMATLKGKYPEAFVG